MEAADVGDLLRRLNAVRELGEDELDAHIGDCARLSEKAMAEGDPAAAVQWAERMYEGIQARSPAHRQRLEEEAMQRVCEGVGYFAWQGELDRQRMQQEGRS